MIGAITPLAQNKSGSRRRWMSVVLAYTMGSLITSMILGGLLGFAGRTFGGPWSWGRTAIIGIALGLAIVELSPHPNRMTIILALTWRQTKKTWRDRYGPAFASFLWGIDLGSGLTTRVNFVSYWLVVCTSFLLSDPIYGILLMGGYGFGRAVEVATGSLFNQVEEDHLDIQLGLDLIQSEFAWHRLHAAVLVLASGILLLGV